jgi:hypothetical protein
MCDHQTEREAEYHEHHDHLDHGEAALAVRAHDAGCFHRT